MAKKAKRPRGAPVGNQNARTHGYFSRVFTRTQQMDFEVASGVDGIDDEIALLRVKIIAVLENDPENLKLIMQAAHTVARMVKTRYDLNKEQRKGLKEAIGNVFRDIAVPLGIGIGTMVGKKS
jgi:hypothetical protein